MRKIKRNDKIIAHSFKVFAKERNILVSKENIYLCVCIYVYASYFR